MMVESCSLTTYLTVVSTPATFETVFWCLSMSKDHCKVAGSVLDCQIARLIESRCMLCPCRQLDRHCAVAGKPPESFSATALQLALFQDLGL